MCSLPGADPESFSHAGADCAVRKDEIPLQNLPNNGILIENKMTRQGVLNMDMTNESKMQIAVLIDSENVSSRYASIIFNEIETY